MTTEEVVTETIFDTVAENMSETVADVTLSTPVVPGPKSFGDVMLESLPDNWFIIAACVLAIVALASSVVWARNVNKHFDRSNGGDLKRDTYYWLDISYTVFVTTISMFPLFGMLGTVISLIGLGNVFQTSGSDMSEIKSEFFFALTSTAWGIIFSLLFKFINALLQPFIENQIDKAKKVLKI